MKTAMRVFLILLAASAAFGQRWDNNTWTTIGSGPSYLISIPNATITFCNYPAVLNTAGNCTNLATAYTNLTLDSACPSGLPVVWQGTSQCRATTDFQGNFGFYAASGFYTYTVTYRAKVYGPYNISIGGSGGGGSGGTPQVNSDWTETNSALPSFILHKPNIPPQVNSDWTETNSALPSFILHKPNIPFQLTLQSGGVNLAPSANVDRIEGGTGITTGVAGNILTISATSGLASMITPPSHPGLNYAILYPTSASTYNNSTVTTYGQSIGTSGGSGYVNRIKSASLGDWDVWINYGGFSLPSYVTAANVQYIHAFVTSSGNFNCGVYEASAGQGGISHVANIIFTDAEWEMSGLGAGQADTLVASGGAASSFNFATTSISVDNADTLSVSSCNDQWYVNQVGLIVFYSGGSQQTQNLGIHVIPPLNYNLALSSLSMLPATDANDGYMTAADHQRLAATGGGGNVNGPSTSISGNVVSFNGTSGKLIQDSGKGLPTGTIVGTTDTQTLTNKTVDGVSPTTMSYVDPTSSIQTQLNNKLNIGTAASTYATLASPAMTGTPTVNGTALGTGAFAPAAVLTGVQADGTDITPTAGKVNYIAGTNITLTPSGNSVTITASNTAATAFSAITAATNNNGPLVIGTGASLATSGSGTITATSLAANGANCTAGQAPLGVDASGAAEGCTAYQAPLTAGSVPLANIAAQAADTVIQNATGSSASPTAVAIPDCQDAGGNHLNYNTTTHAWGCGSTGGTAGSAAFNTITSGTSTSANMTVGTGATLTVSGSGVNNANQLNGAVVPTSKTIVGTNSSGQLVDATGATLSNNISGTAGGLSSNIAESQVTNLTSDLAAKAPNTNPTLTIGSSLSAGTCAGSKLPLTASGLTTGSVYYVKTDGTLTAALADSSANLGALMCVASSATTCMLSGSACRYSSSQSWTVGGQVYLDDSTAGALTQTAPSTSGHWLVPVGVALANDTIAINFLPPAAE